METEDIRSHSVRALGNSAAADKLVYGGKASTLSRLKAAGFPVPAGVAVPSTSYIRHVGVLAGQRPAEMPFKVWAAEVRERILSEPIPAGTVDMATDAISTLPAANSGWIVRSSAVGEDSASNSFAGQLDSFSDVEPEAMGDAIRSVWASAWSPRAADYRERRGLVSVADLPVAVLIQQFVEPVWAGVLFTTAPFPGSNEALIEAVRGRGEALVSGAVEPARYWLDSDGAVLRSDVSEPPGIDPRLLTELHAVGLRLADLLGGPQDIEWAVSGAGLCIVQSRPITTVSAPLPEADPAMFVGHVVEVSAANRIQIPGELADKDKFKLRLVATESDADISRGWLVSIQHRADAHAGMPLADVAALVAAHVERFPQVSMVLQRPGRLDGEIIRKFSSIDDLNENLNLMVQNVGSHHQSFDLIITEIYQAEKSGISHIVNGQLVVEVAYGSYVPKGVVPTSLYVTDADNAPRLEQSVFQENGVFIEAGQAVERPVNATATLTADQLAVIEQLTQVVSAQYPDVSVEFGVLADGTPYLIDIIPDMLPVAIDNVRVMSAGQLTGIARVAASEELAARSLNAHFHSERSAERDSAMEATVIIAPRPFLALEDYLSRYETGSLAFVFEQGSLLGHLAIILRENKVPAIVAPDIRQLLDDGDTVTIDTSSEELFSVARTQAGA